MSPLVPKCDCCGLTTRVNAAAQSVTSTRDKLTVRIDVVKSNGSANPIICPRCVKLAAYHGSEVAG